jgi:hypothetical protein
MIKTGSLINMKDITTDKEINNVIVLNVKKIYSNAIRDYYVYELLYDNVVYKNVDMANYKVI